MSEVDDLLEQQAGTHVQETALRDRNLDLGVLCGDCGASTPLPERSCRKCGWLLHSFEPGSAECNANDGPAPWGRKTCHGWRIG